MRLQAHPDDENCILLNEATDSKESFVLKASQVIQVLNMDASILLTVHQIRNRDVTHNAFCSLGHGTDRELLQKLKGYYINMRLLKFASPIRRKVVIAIRIDIAN